MGRSMRARDSTRLHDLVLERSLHNILTNKRVPVPRVSYRFWCAALTAELPAHLKNVPGTNPRLRTRQARRRPSMPNRSRPSIRHDRIPDAARPKAAGRAAEEEGSQEVK